MSLYIPGKQGLCPIPWCLSPPPPISNIDRVRKAKMKTDLSSKRTEQAIKEKRWERRETMSQIAYKYNLF